jgi:hypothetical protein
MLLPVIAITVVLIVIANALGILLGGFLGTMSVLSDMGINTRKVMAVMAFVVLVLAVMCAHEF